MDITQDLDGTRVLKFTNEETIFFNMNYEFHTSFDYASLT